ncbi:MAG: hypothetical protein ACI3XI_05985 [Eubacteriales bacterium]
MNISNLFIRGTTAIHKFHKFVGNIGKIPIMFFKAGCTLVILALTGIYLLCEREVLKGGIGVELYYAPMLDYILTAFIIFWAGMLFLDIIQKDIRRK